MAATATVTSDWTAMLVTDVAAGDGAWYRAHSGSPDRRIGTEKTMVDLWAPLGIPIQYYWKPATGAVQSTNTIIIDPPGPVLSSALGAGSLLVRIVSQPPARWEGRSVAHAILGRPDPLVTVAKMTYHSAVLRLWAADRAAVDGLVALAQPGGPLILRTKCDDRVRDATIMVRSLTEQLVSASQPAGPRWVDIDYQAVMDDMNRYQPLPLWTWADMEAGIATWDDVPVTFATWADAEVRP